MRGQFQPQKISTFNDSDFIKSLELAIKYGSPFLFKDVEGCIDPVIDDMLGKNLEGSGQQMTVRLGDRDVDYDPNFRLYLSCHFLADHGYKLHSDTKRSGGSAVERDRGERASEVRYGQGRTDHPDERQQLPE